MFRVAVALLALVTTTAVARANVEVGGSAGVHLFSDKNGLGVPDGSTDSQKNSSLFSVRLGVFFTPAIGVEAEGGLLPTEPKSTVFDVFDLVVRAQLVYQFRTGTEHALIPFVLAGGGIMKVVYSVNETIISKEQNFVPHAGVGVKYRTGGGWAVRADARLMLPPSSDKGMTEDFEFLLSLSREFGGVQPPAKTEEPPPKKGEDDPDHDGIVGAADKCPNQPEDKDGFQDEDGCPDPDNDQDGIPDAKDKCPNEAEDKDGFQDEDGCPDPDNDQDGIPDAADKCPDQPETKNGFQDDDGCPDEVPEKLKQFTGVIQGINFKVNSADLAGGTQVLDKAVAVLNEFKEIKLEIQGHTDDQPMTSKQFADNMALSQARAESVKAYFVKKGVDESRLVAKGYGDTAPIQDPKDLKGNALNAARAKNRRVEFKLISSADTGAAEKPPEDKQKAPEEKAPEKKAPEEKAPEKKAPEKKAPEKK
jgi:OmpA-OmpF porin, OOP family